MYKRQYEAEDIGYVKYAHKTKNITEEGYFIALGDDDHKGVFIDRHAAMALGMEIEQYESLLSNAGGRRSKIDQGFIFDTKEEVEQAIAGLQIAIKLCQK
jgi:hypothetical protein